MSGDVTGALHWTTRRGNGSKLYAFGMIVCMTNVANTVQSSYSKWSAKYVEVAGAISKTHPSDRALVSTWADSLTGPVLPHPSSPGCGYEQAKPVQVKAQGGWSPKPSSPPERLVRPAQSSFVATPPTALVPS